MKKLSLILAIAMTLGMSAMATGCGDSSESDVAETTKSTINATTKATTKNNSDSYSYNDENDSSHVIAGNNNYDDDETFYCMGKGDTCSNKTYSATDFYCHSCDPDNNNIEGDQTDGIIGDNDYNNDIDEDDWETEWDNYLNDALNDYDGGYGW